MHNRGNRALVAVLAAATAVGLVVGATPAQAAPARTDSLSAAQNTAAQNTKDIADRLRAIPGLTIVSDTQTTDGYRFFMLTFRQAVDHHNPRGATFEQRFQLLHKDTSRPMILHTTGYDMPDYPFRSEPTRLVDGNQISVEQRFFTPSRPDPADWDDLDIWQAATDHHLIVQALKPIYSARWISTGASKGGMTSVYHRRFYPHDVDGVVAYVAPNDVINTEDRAYDRFFRTVGDRDCRTKLEDVQKEALKRRAAMVAKYQATADANKWTFNTLGSIDRAYEETVLDTEWAFWQYSLQSDCPSVPVKTASDDELYAFIDATAGFAFYADQGITKYNPYYYQAATQLGWPAPKFEHLRGLLRYPGLYQANSNLPKELRRPHDPRPMIDVDRWVRTQSSQMLFIYGSNDPWGAEQFQPSCHDSSVYTAPGANHGANIAALSPADKDAATAAVLRWANVTAPAVSSRGTDGLTDLDRAEPRNDRRYPLL
ncbi:S28 family serine protease [Actinokineospora enzanensis]|uniref:S28 family serine protease n=1 Tax=Actinokineospora enzanensis TaxID=155975 RepID=UPI00037656B8|nr:S28 family serine protease [Actinokineospora enzanensis]